MAKYSAFGTKIYRGTSGAGTEIAQVVSLTGPSLSADVIDVTTMDSTDAFEESVIGVLRSGDVSMDIVYDPANATHKNAAGGLLADYLGRASTTYTIVFTDAASSEFTFSAFVTGFEPSTPHDGDLGASVVLKPTGSITLV